MSEEEVRRRLFEMAMEESDKLMREALGITSNVGSQPAPELTRDMLVEMQQQLRKYEPPIPLGDMYLIGRTGDTALLKNAIEKADPHRRVTTSQYNEMTRGLVILLIDKTRRSLLKMEQPTIIKVYVETLEQTLAQWERDGAELAELIKRLEAAQERSHE